MLVRQIAVPCPLIVSFRMRRIDQAVLLVEHDVTGNKASADIEYVRVCRQFKEYRLISHRQPDRIVFVDGLERLCSAMFRHITLPGTFECLGQGLKPARSVAAVDNGVAEMTDRFAGIFDIGFRHSLFGRAVPPGLIGWHETSRRSRQTAAMFRLPNRD
jgi:hypothetical protein